MNALQYMMAKQYDLVLMDVHMAEMDGYETTQSMTADTMDVAKKRCIEAGMNKYISKPINIRELYSAITNLFDDLEFEGNLSSNGGRAEDNSNEGS